MNQNGMAIAILCSRLCMGEGVKPLEPKEWSTLANAMRAQKIQPADLLEYSGQDFAEKFQYSQAQIDRVRRLIDRSASLGFELDRYASQGITVVTRADEGYPVQLKRKLGNACPPLFYVSGALELLERKSVGYVGSRAVSEEDIDFVRQTVAKTVGRDYLVVSGGAKGADSVAMEEALEQGGGCIAYLADSMERKLKHSRTVMAIQEGRLLLLSAVNPSAGFHAGMAMARNKYIYAQSSGTVVVRSDYNKGGTWSGATEDLRNGWCPVFCWDRPDYPGNQALIRKGAHPIDRDWPGDVAQVPPGPEGPLLERETDAQLSMFD